MTFHLFSVALFYYLLPLVVVVLLLGQSTDGHLDGPVLTKCSLDLFICAVDVVFLKLLFAPQKVFFAVVYLEQAEKTASFLFLFDMLCLDV